MQYEQKDYNPYQAPSSDLSEAYDDQQYEYAGFWMRFAASIIDSILIGLAVGVPLTIVGDFMGIAAWDSADVSIVDVVSQVICFVVYVYCWVTYAGTPGKRLLKLKVLDADTGEHLSGGRAALRYVGYFVSAIAVFLGFLWVVFDKRKQAWHDKMANSVVVKEI